MISHRNPWLEGDDSAPSSSGSVGSSSVCNTEKSLRNQQKVSRIVRNRTILGSFPLFYKLSQSLSSLNSGGAVSVAEGSSVSGKCDYQNSLGRHVRMGKDFGGGITPVQYPISPGCTLGGGSAITSSIITEYGTGCFYLEDITIKDR